MKKLLSFLLVAVLCVSCLTACGKKADSEQAGDKTVVESADALERAKELLFAMYKAKQGTTASDIERVAFISVDGVQYPIDWSVNVSEGVKVIPGSTMTTIDIFEETPNEINFTLTATIKDAAGNSVTQDFTHNVPAYKETTFAEYAAAADDTTVVCTGVVTGLIAKSIGNSSNCIYFQDNDGGYYAYNLGSDPIADLGLKLGMTVKVTGKKSTYSGTYEIVESSVQIVDSSIKAVEPVDYTAKFTAAASLKDADLVAQQAMLVTVKGVEITSQDTASGYYRFKLGDLESYERISSSVCPIVADKDAFIAAHAEHVGWLANVTGVLCVYDGAFYLTPVTTDAIEYVSLPTKSDAEMVEFEAENVSFASKYAEAATVELPAVGSTYDSVAITWTTSDEAVAAIADGVLNIVVPGADTVVTVTGTFAVGSETLVKEFTFTVEAPADDMCQAEILDKLFALESGEYVNGIQVLQGTVTAIVTEYSSEYGNITVDMDVDGRTVQAYRLAGGEDLAVGDVIVVTGSLTRYKDTYEFAKGCTYSKELTVEEAKQNVVLDKLFALESGESMNGTYALQGTVAAIVTEYNPEYGNITVDLDVAGRTVQAYRLTGGEDLAVGDVITVTGSLTRYKDTYEFAKGCTFVKGQSLEDAKDLIVMAKAFALEEGAAMTGLQEVKGVVSEIVTEYSAEYGNITVNMTVGDYTIQCFRLIGGEDLAVGDEITVTGRIKNYKGTVEFDSKCTFVK